MRRLHSNGMYIRRAGSIDSLAPLAHPSGFVYVAPLPRAPFPPGVLFVLIVKLRLRLERFPFTRTDAKVRVELAKSISQIIAKSTRGIESS
jgi:hypothetical protein